MSANFKKFEFLDITTADAAFVSFGKDLNEVFSNAGLALFEIITDTKNVETKQERKIEVTGHDLKSVMYSWLSELLFISSSENILFSKFKVELNEDEFTLRAKCWGEEIDLDKHELKAEVKAITYHKMEIKKEDSLWKAQIIVDI